MQLGANEAENRKAWDNLGKLPWYQPVPRLHPLATALAEHPTDTCVDGKTPQPLIAIRQYGKGEVVYLGFNETWRLRRQVWREVLPPVLGADDPSPGPEPRPGQPEAVRRPHRPAAVPGRRQGDVTVEAYDANFEPLADDKLPDRKLTGRADRAATAPAKSTSRSRFTCRSSAKACSKPSIPVFDGRRAPRARQGSRHRQSSRKSHFQVTQPLGRATPPRVRNVALQEEIAQATGGQSYDLDDRRRLADDIELEAA